jgi:hypothetical protein
LFLQVQPVVPGKAAFDGKLGGARRDRTADLLHAMQALSQLSYGPIRGSEYQKSVIRKPWINRMND